MDGHIGSHAPSSGCRRANHHALTIVIQDAQKASILEKNTPTALARASLALALFTEKYRSAFAAKGSPRAKIAPKGYLRRRTLLHLADNDAIGQLRSLSALARKQPFTHLQGPFILAPSYRSPIRAADANRIGNGSLIQTPGA